MASELSAIILAAGLSSRMGELKPLLHLGESTVLGQCITVLKNAGAEDIVVVTGNRAAEVAAEAQVHKARPEYNPVFSQGMFSSIRAGAKALNPASSAVFLLPVDMPLIRVGTFHLLQEHLLATKAEIAHPVFCGKRGHPLCIRASLLKDFGREKDHAAGLRPLLAAYERDNAQRVIEVAVADANILIDLDTPEAYRGACALYMCHDYPTIKEAEVIVSQIHPMPPKGLAHGHLVGELAALFATTINRQNDITLNASLCHVSGLLHDLAKGQPCHETKGSQWLIRLGFPRAAAIVAVHKDLLWQEGMPITERELVHLADKLVRGSALVTIENRFAEKLALYAHDKEAQAAITRRLDLAKRLAGAVEVQCGQDLYALARQVVPAPC